MSKMQENVFETMKTSPKRQYDLEERTFVFAQNVRVFAKRIAKTLASIEDIKQVIRASGSVGANYIEANESLSKKDFIMRIKICRKEAKESRLFLRLINTDGNPNAEGEKASLIQGAQELTNIFG